MSSDPGGTALITGASAGIGRALADEFAAGGYDLVVVARREERLERLAADVERDQDVAVHVVPMDLAEPDAANVLHDAVADLPLRVDALVNNAGIGTYGPFHESDPEAELSQLRLNVELPVHLTRLFLPAMVERDDGVVLNVSSMSAFQPGPRMAGYYASKAYVQSFSEALVRELKGTGVSVTALCPGPVSTEFQERAGMDDSRVGSTFSHTTEEVARAGYRGAMAGEPVVVPGLGMKLLYLASRVAPRPMQRRAAAWINADR
jgi:short-subunit dehydrogenase